MNPEPVNAHTASALHRVQIGLVAFACRRPRAVLAAALALVALSVYASSAWTEYRTQRSDLISPHKDYQQRWQKYLAEFGDDDDVVVVVRGADRERMKAALEHLAAGVAARPDRFDRLFYKVDLRPLRNRALQFLPTEQIAQIQANIKSMSMLLEFGPLGWRSLTLYRLLHEAGERAKHLTPGKPLSPSDDQFFTQLLSISRTAAATVADPAAYHNPWNSLVAKQPEQTDLLAEPQFFFSGDGSLAFLLARPVKEAGSFTGASQSIDAVRAIVAGAREAFPDLEFGLTGLPVLENDEMAAAQHDTRVASWLAIAGVSLLFLIVYRSLYYPLLTVGTLLLGTSLAMGWMALTVGHLNILSATFAVMLIGMGDYGVLWVMRYEHERRRGATVETALRDTAVYVGAGTLTAALTTALAFYAAMLADFQAVAELGWIAGSGVLLCALSCFTILPALLKLFDRRTFNPTLAAPVQRTTDYGPRTSDAWLPRLTGSRCRWVLAGGLALTAVLAASALHVRYDHNLLHLQVRGLDSVKWEMTLIEHTAGASWHALSYTDTPQQALALKARYEQLPEVSRVVEVASLVPQDEATKLVMLGDIQHRLRWLPRRGAVIPHELPDVAGLRKEAVTLAGRLAPAAAGGPPLLADLKAGLAALVERLDGPVAGRLQDFEQRMAGDLAADLYRLRDVSTPAPIALTDLPQGLRERYIGRTGKWLLQVFGKDCLWDFEPLAHFTSRIQTVDPAATGKPFATVEGLRAMKSGFEWAGLYALAAIVAVLLLDFRHVGRALVALSPLAVGVLLALGVLGLAGLPLNPANMIAFPLVLGVGVDNGVHLLHDYLAHRATGRPMLSRAIGRGVLVKALTTMIGFGTLMISSQRGLAGLGLCLTLGVACCMTTALVFLPAVLHAFGGRAPRRAEPVAEPRPMRRAA